MAAKRQTLNIRVKPQERGLIDRAAQSLGKTRTDFILEAARRAAEDALSDRTLFVVGAEAYGEFIARLEAHPQPNKRLRRALRRRAPWDKA